MAILSDGQFQGDGNPEGGRGDANGGGNGGEFGPKGEGDGRDGGKVSAYDETLPNDGEPEWVEVRSFTQLHIYWLARYLAEGYNLDNARIHFKYEYGIPEMKKEVRRHGYIISRKLIPLPFEMKRAWKRGYRALTLEGLKEVERWLKVEHYTPEQIAKLINVHFGYRLMSAKDLIILLRVSGYAWVYCIDTRENAELNH